MSRRPKGPRLYFREGRVHSRTGQPLVDVWTIRDGSREISTGCGYDGLSGPGGAEDQLAAYIVKKQRTEPTAPTSRSDPTQVLVAEVVALYATERAQSLSLDPATLAGFVRNLLAWWGDRPLADVKRSTCQAYVKHRTAMPNASYKDPKTAPRVSSETARRELEALSGAIAYWNGEDQLTSRPDVWLPKKPESPRDALTRSQAASLLWAAMGWRLDPATGVWKRLQPSSIKNRRHLRRFILISAYTGSRHKVTLTGLWEESAAQPWADLDRNVIYRRGREEADKPTKRRPVVKIPRRLAAHMRRWREMDRRLEAKLQEDNPDFRLVSIIHHGARPLAGKIRTGFEGCVRDAGLPEEITPHWLRHTAATWLMESNTDIWDAAGFLGMTPATLLKHYGHLRPDYQASAADGVSTKKGHSGDQSGDRKLAV